MTDNCGGLEWRLLLLLFLFLFFTKTDSLDSEVIKFFVAKVKLSRLNFR